jgi:bacterioferritin
MLKAQPKIVSDTGRDVVSSLNIVLRNELTGINQYFLHARILKHMGFMKLADFEYKESLDEMKHADQVINRILFLGGLPNLQALGDIRIGQKVDEILKADLALEDAARGDLKVAIAACSDAGDTSSATMLQSILDSEDQHVQFIRTQLNLIDTMGLTAYLQTQV